MMIALKMWIRLRSCDDGMTPTYRVLKDSVVLLVKDWRFLTWRV